MNNTIDSGETVSIDDRVELHPATDAWMFGDRYGVVVTIGRKYVHVKMDRSGRTLRLVPTNVLRIVR
jgi:hypothetical protein